MSAYVQAPTDPDDAAEAARAHLQLVADTMPAYVAHCGHDLRYRWVNRQYAARFGLTPEDVAGRTIAEVLGARAFAAIRAYVDRVLAGEAVDVEVEIPYERLGTRWMHVIYAPVLDTGSRPDGWVSVVTDVSRRYELEDALRSSEARARSLMELLPVAVYTCDTPTGRISYYNRAAVGLWGGPPSAAAYLGGFIRAFRADGSELPLTEAPMARVLAGGPPVRGEELDVQRADGARRTVLANVDPIEDAHGTRIGAINVLQDVTEHRRFEQALRRSERLYRAVGESIDYGIWVAEPDGRNVYCSESFLRLVGLTQEQCSAFGWGAVLHPDDAEATVAAWKECVRTGRFWEREHRYRGVDGAWHHVLARGVPIRDDDGRITCWAGINLDIGALKHAHEQLEDSDRRKDEFLATLAHELRNPLAPIRSAVEVLRLAGPAEPRVEWARAVIDRQMQQLTRLVDDLLDVSRITRGKLELRREIVPVGLILERALETSRPALEAAGHRLSIAAADATLHVDGDPTRLAQALSNLLNNAARYTPRGGSVAVAAEAEADGAIAIRVVDDGVGIAGDMLERVFDMFAQLQAPADRSEHGLGIGLTIAQRLVEMHGGTLAAASDGPQRGSTFTMRVPRAPAPTASNPSPAAAAPRARRRVLVVDDNHDAAESLAMLIETLGNVVQVAHDGEEALAAAPAFAPDVVFLDIGMPRMDGYQVAARLRALPGLHGTRLVAMTGWGQEEDRRRSRDAGFDAHLVKPAELPDIEAVLATAVGP